MQARFVPLLLLPYLLGAGVCFGMDDQPDENATVVSFFAENPHCSDLITTELRRKTAALERWAIHTDQFDGGATQLLLVVYVGISPRVSGVESFLRTRFGDRFQRQQSFALMGGEIAEFRFIGGVELSPAELTELRRQLHNLTLPN